MATATEIGSHASVIADRDHESVTGVRRRFQELSNLIGSLSEKLTLVRNDQEKEFLSAYRVHMLNVQLELKELSTRVAKAEEFLQVNKTASEYRQRPHLTCERVG